jgi:hypothetical protein
LGGQQANGEETTDAVDEKGSAPAATNAQEDT